MFIICFQLYLTVSNVFNAAQAGAKRNVFVNFFQLSWEIQC